MPPPHSLIPLDRMAPPRHCRRLFLPPIASFYRRRPLPMSLMSGTPPVPSPPLVHNPYPTFLPLLPPPHLLLIDISASVKPDAFYEMCVTRCVLRDVCYAIGVQMRVTDAYACHGSGVGVWAGDLARVPTCASLRGQSGLHLLHSDLAGVSPPATQSSSSITDNTRRTHP